MTITTFMNAVLENVFAKAAEEEQGEVEVSSTDSLTGLLTKTGLTNAAPKILARGGLLPDSYAAISIDLDYIKQAGSDFDQGTTERVIKEVAHRIRTSVRSEDLVARTDTDEFVILMPNIKSEIAVLNISDRLLATVSQPIVDDTVHLQPSLNIGISMSGDKQNPVFEEVLYRSDLALQQAKMICRGTVHFFDQSMVGETDRRLEIEQDLRNAAANNELRLHYQPIYDIRRSVISHVEALVRWQHPEFGLVPPADFIPLAESSGLIQSIGIWVLRQAFEDLSTFDAHGLGEIAITVNFSPEQLKLLSIVDAITEVGQDFPDYKGRIALELTEDVVIDERYQMSSKLEALREAGFPIYLDDFGTGNANIVRLRNFNFDAIKIDRSLVTNLDQNEADLAVVRSILFLAQSLGVTVIAEGVETQSCLTVLAREKCQYAQGYHFSEPLPLDQTIEVIKQRFETSDLAQVLVSI